MSTPARPAIGRVHSFLDITSNSVVCFLVLLCSARDHLLAHPHPLFALQALLDQPIPQKLLVETLLGPPDLVLVFRPEPRRIGRQDLIGQHNLVRLRVEPKLELRVGDDDAPGEGVVVGNLVELEGERGDGRGVGFPDQSGRLVRMDVLIVLAELRLRAWGVDGPVGESLALPQSGGDLDAVHGARLLVLLPRRSGDVPAHDALDREHLQLAHLHAAVLQRRAEGRGDLGREVEREEVGAEGGDRVREDLQPGLGAEGEQDALVGDAVLHDHVVRGDAVGRDEEERLVVHLVQVAHLAPRDEGQRALEVYRRECAGHGCGNFSAIGRQKGGLESETIGVQGIEV